MPHVLIDALVWNYIGKARALSGFLAWLGTDAVTLTEVIDQLRPALGSWPELSSILDAQEKGEIEAVELDEDEEALRFKFLVRWPGLGPVDCGLMAVAKERDWRLLTCDKALLRKAKEIHIVTADLASLLNEAVRLGFLSYDDRTWAVAFSNGYTGQRDDR